MIPVNSVHLYKYELKDMELYISYKWNEKKK